MLNHLSIKFKMILLSVLAVLSVGIVISYLAVKQAMRICLNHCKQEFDDEDFVKLYLGVPRLPSIF